MRELGQSPGAGPGRESAGAGAGRESASEPARGAAFNKVDADFRQFVAARSASLQRTAYLLVGDWAHAEDVLQTALTKTYLAWKRLGEIEAVEAYARRVLVNTATSWRRRRWHGERPTEIMPEGAAPDRISERLERQEMWRHVLALPARQRAVLVLRFYEDLTEVETARVLGVAVGTVKSQCARALASLRTRLVEASIEPAGIALREERAPASPAVASTASTAWREERAPASPAVASSTGLPSPRSRPPSPPPAGPTRDEQSMSEGGA